MIQPIYLIVALWFFTTGVSAADSVGSSHQNQESPLTGKHILQKMSLAVRRSNFQGTIAFLRDGKLEPMKYFHAVQNGVEQERLLTLNSPLKEMVREAGKTSCFYQKNQHQRVDNKPFDRSFLVDLPANIDQLETAYTIELAGEESIALLPAYVINLNPIDNLRYPRTIWVEAQHYLPLQAIVYGRDSNGAMEILEQMVFTDIAVKDSIPFVKTLPAHSQGLINKPTPLPVSEANFIVNPLPKGFVKLFFNRRLMHNEARPVDQLVISDGLAWISIYMEYQNMEPTEANEAENGVIHAAVGAINFYSRSLAGYEFTVMGDVPLETVKLIAKNIQLHDDP